MPPAPYVSYLLVFPADLTAKQAVRWVQAVSGIGTGGLSRLFSTPPTIVLECWSTARGISYRLRVPLAHADFVAGQLRTLLPGARVMPEADHRAAQEWTAAVELGMRRLDRTLHIPEPEVVCASLLAGISSGLGHGEALLLQLVISPAVKERPPEHMEMPRQPGRHWLLDGLAGTGKLVTKDRQAKLETPNFLAVLRCAAKAANEERARQLLLPVRGALTSLGTDATGFYKRLIPDGRLRRDLAAGRPPLLFPGQLAAPEVIALTAWPMGQPHVAGLSQARTRHLAPTEAIARIGRVVARSNFPGAERPLALTPRALATHLHLVGPTQSGKTTLAAGLARQHYEAGAAVIVIESKGDLFSLALDAVPDNRIDDVIIFDVAREAARPVGYNVLAEGNPRAAVEDLVLLFEHLYPDMRRGVWARAALHRGLMTLITRKDSTVVDLVPLLSAAARSDAETAWRDELIAGVRDPELRRFWQRFTALPAMQQENYAAPVLDRIWQLQERPEIRHIIGQGASTFTMREVLREKKILLVNLAGLGRTTSGLVGTLLLNNLWGAVRVGAARGSEPAYLLLDEFQDFVNLPVDPEEWLTKAASLNLSVTVMHQHLNQLPPELRAAVMANVRSKMIFQTTADDARSLSREFGRQVSEEDFLNLGKYEVLMKLMGSDGVSSPVTGVTYPPARPTGNAALVRHRSRQRYGRDLAQVEAEIVRRRSPRRPAPERQRPKVGPQKWE